MLLNVSNVLVPGRFGGRETYFVASRTHIFVPLDFEKGHAVEEKNIVYASRTPPRPKLWPAS